MCYGLNCPYENHTTGKCGWFGGFPYPSDASCVTEKEIENEPINLKEYYDDVDNWTDNGVEGEGILDSSDPEGFSK